MQRILNAFAATLIATAAMAEEKDITLKPGSGRDRLEANCNACHSLDYIQMNSPFPNAALWEVEVKKMIGTFGAPINDDDAKAILEYLKTNYGS
jgi:mono/diheme cytochrome c family protein